MPEQVVTSVQRKFRYLVLFTLSFVLLSFANGFAQTDTVPAPKVEKPSNWYDKIHIRGYAQFRYNRLLETNENLGNEQADKSWGKNGGFFIRRMRLVFYGQIDKNIYVYIQPDFASSPSADKLHFGQLRDAYIDLGIDKENEFRFRIGQSKVPYGFENMQSSQNRLPLDRSDGMNSAIANERDLGVFFYWAPKKKRELFSKLVSSGLKGSGDYGLFAFGVYNGQTANVPELNSSLHWVSRFTYPFEINSQVVELGFQAYSGQFVIPKANVTSGVLVNPDYSYLDQRYAASFTLYPKPFGLQAEYNLGTGPEYNPSSNAILEKDLNGGYVMASYMIKWKQRVLIPFARYHFYEGGKKQELDARSYSVQEEEIGLEYQLNKNFEVVAHYTISDRRYEDSKLRNNHQLGNLLRLQAQVNF